jgi:hypothetical protein
MGGIGPQQTDLVNSRMGYQRREWSQTAAVTAVTYPLGAPMIAPGGRMRVTRVGLHLAAAGGASADFIFNVVKVIGDDSGRPVLAHGERVPLLSLAASVPVNTADGYHLSTDENSGGPLVPTFELLLAPDEKPARRHGGTSVLGGSATTSKLQTSGTSTIDKYYIGSFVKRLDTGEVREITDYSQAARLYTHVAWTGGATMAAGVPYELTHDNLILRPSDSLLVVIASANTTPAVLPTFYVEMVELSKFSAAI